MKQDLAAKNKLKSTVLHLHSEQEGRCLLTRVLGESLLSRQIDGLRVHGVEEVIFLVPTVLAQLRQEIRQEAINQPLKIQTLNLDSKYSFYQNLGQLKAQLPEKFFLTAAVNLDAGYDFEQLHSWQAEVVVATCREKPSKLQGSVQVKEKLVTKCSSQVIRDYFYLTGSLVITQAALGKMAKGLLTKKDWFAALNQLAEAGVMKACEFSVSQKLPEIEQKSYLLAVCRRFFAKNDAGISERAKIAPTARLKGKVIIAPEVEIGEYCCLEGPIYLGAGVKVGNFANLRPDLYVEAGNAIGSYQELGGRHVPELS